MVVSISTLTWAMLMLIRLSVQSSVSLGSPIWPAIWLNPTSYISSKGTLSLGEPIVEFFGAMESSLLGAQTSEIRRTLRCLHTSIFFAAPSPV